MMLYPNNHSDAQMMGTENTNTESDATFSITATLTIKKSGGAELAGKSFLFTVVNSDTNRGLPHHRKAISNKNVQNRPESEQFGRCWAFFYALLADNLREHKSISLRPFATCLAPIQTICYNV